MKEGYKPVVICSPLKNWVHHHIPNHNIYIPNRSLTFCIVIIFLLIENLFSHVLEERSILKTVPMYNMIDMRQYNVYATNCYFHKSKVHFSTMEWHIGPIFKLELQNYSLRPQKVAF